VYLALTQGTSPAEIGLLFAFMAAGAIVSASQAGRLMRGRDPARVLFVGFALAGGSLLVVPLGGSFAFAAGCIFVYGLGNGIISPL